MRSGGLGTVRPWAYPVLLAGVALGFDVVNRHVQFGLLSTGPLDEVAHLATAALGLLVLAPFWMNLRARQPAAFPPRRHTLVTGAVPCRPGTPGPTPGTILTAPYGRRGGPS